MKRTERANAIRILSMDSVEKSNSGHPGAPMGMADIAEVLWMDYLKHNPSNPTWCNRDRFVLSNGHASMLLYSLLHLSGYDLTIDDLKKFRQLNSRTPGHPEYNINLGVETTTGPLGQGLANAVGMAIAEKTLSAQFNRPNHNIVDHYTYVFLGDGCLMEGISHEVASLAGTLKLGKLICFYDDNGISIDGKTTGWFTDNTALRFKSYGWQVINPVDGHNYNNIIDAIEKARKTDIPTLICCQTIIGFGSPNKAGHESCHGSPLGTQEIQLTRKNLAWHHPSFVIPESIYKEWNACKKGQIIEKKWQNALQNYTLEFPQLAKEFLRRIKKKTPDGFHQKITSLIKKYQDKPQAIATRKASQNILNNLCPQLPELLGGSADLAHSNLVFVDQSVDINTNAAGNYIFYGVREFGMTAITNGIALHGGFIPYNATFLTFTDYARNAVRMSALMKLHVIHVYTHDSIGLGEDGPTHQPLEHLATLRMTPDINTWRPCDEIEATIAWQQAIEYQGPTALIFSRQTLEPISQTQNSIDNIKKGGYIIRDCSDHPELIFISSGSELSLAIKAHSIMLEKGYQTRVVSMPCTTIFDNQPTEYQKSVLPRKTIRIAIEASHCDYWYKYTGLNGCIIGMRTFGESGPGSELFTKFGFTTENIIKIAIQMLEKQ